MAIISSHKLISEVFLRDLRRSYVYLRNRNFFLYNFIVCVKFAHCCFWALKSFNKWLRSLPHHQKNISGTKNITGRLLVTSQSSCVSFFSVDTRCVVDVSISLPPYTKRTTKKDMLHAHVCRRRSGGIIAWSRYGLIIDRSSMTKL